ncbi:MAG: RraA family protein [Candidatus Poribacteria bacterium]|jgi:regulator of RNase E activity RraA|nr:RraA family protein [Candidatus Poribacteria bacterium]MDP6961749.1 RraA family protein [Dehalococcoidia bacterium]
MAFELDAKGKHRKLTPSYQGLRYRNGRPKVNDDILRRMKQVTVEEAWGVLGGKGHHFQFDGDWLNLHPDRVIVGRAVTCRYVPHRPDLNEVVEADGERNKRVGGQNSWVIDMLVKDDVLVVELFGKIVKGTFIGDNLGTAINVNTGGTGVVIDGSIRDDERVRQLPFNVLCRGTHPTAIGEVTMAEINGPVRIGDATCMPGDVVLAKESGVVFIPPQYAEEVVENSENVRLRDYWGKKSISDGRYTPGEVDRKWSEEMENEFECWKKKIDVQEIFAQL